MPYVSQDLMGSPGGPNSEALVNKRPSSQSNDLETRKQHFESQRFDNCVLRWGGYLAGNVQFAAPLATNVLFSWYAFFLPPPHSAKNLVVWRIRVAGDVGWGMGGEDFWDSFPFLFEKGPKHI